MRKASTTPRIADLLPAAPSRDTGADASMLASHEASKLANQATSGTTRQLNTRVPVELYSELLRVQAELTVEVGEKPSVQALLAACLRLGLAEPQRLAELLGGTGQGAGRQGI